MALIVSRGHDWHDNKVLLKEDERKTSTMKSLQITQNRMLRVLNRSKVSDKISIKSMREKFGLLSVNQLAAQIKLIEVWKSINVEDSPLRMENYSSHNSELKQALRDRPNRIFNELTKYCISQNSFHIDAARIWNKAPGAVTTATTLTEVKKAVATYVRSLPT